MKNKNIFKNVKKILGFFFLLFKAFVGKIYLFFKPLKITVLSIEDTLNTVNNKRCSIVRFGDGEFYFINKKPTIFQKYDQRLAELMKKVLNTKKDNLLICIPEPVKTTKNLVFKSRIYWTGRLFLDHKCYSILDDKYIYGNAFISRPYIVYKNKKNTEKHFELIKKIWNNKKVLIVEGKYSCTGVGNDLLNNAKTVRRIICPSEDAFKFYDIILRRTLYYARDYDLVLIALGPCAKPLVLELVNHNVWTIDIGHIDSEYEWFLQKTKRKVKIPNKHTAEIIDSKLEICNDEKYNKSIIEKVGDLNG